MTTNNASSVVKAVILAIVVVCLVSILHAYTNLLDLRRKVDYPDEIYTLSMHNLVVEQFYGGRKHWNLTKLGNVLYRNAPYPIIREERRNKTFKVLIWKHWDWLKLRHVYNYGDKPLDPLRKCSVKNCEFTGDNKKLRSADAVVSNLFRGDFPPPGKRNPRQIWIFLDDEPPPRAFRLSKTNVSIETFGNVFNWSMTYRHISDIPVPYGRTIPRSAPVYLTNHFPIQDLIPYWESKQREVLVGILISNCLVQYRLDVIQELKKYIAVDAVGKCGDEHLMNRCPGHFQDDCVAMSQYMFYLALENSKCHEYITEKVFYHAYHKGAIPIIQGASSEDCKKLLPPNSYLHIDDFPSLKDLAYHILEISRDEKKLLSYHQWRNQFQVVNEHGFFGSMSVHFCRICEALNYNDFTEKVYTREMVEEYFSVARLCSP